MVDGLRLEAFELDIHIGCEVEVLAGHGESADLRPPLHLPRLTSCLLNDKIPRIPAQGTRRTHTRQTPIPAW